MVSIFEQKQTERDIELANFYGLSLARVCTLPVLAKESICVFKNEDVVLPSYDFLYTNYQYMNVVHYIRTLSFTTLQRAPYILAMEKALGGLANKRVLDYGCGVGSHGIYCLQKGAVVTFLDVDGPLYNFAKHRINKRKLTANYLYPTSKLEPKSYDAVICLDVLEHIVNPIAAITNIVNSLKNKGVLCLEVSLNIKPTSGHFTQSISAWKQGHAAVMNQFINIELYIYRKK